MKKKNVECPVGEVSGDTHEFNPAEGVMIPWDVMGDNRSEVAVCPTCAKHALA